MIREITTHRASEADDKIEILVMDEPGQGGASHEYLVTVEGLKEPVEINFQNGPVQEFGLNGITIEVLLAIAQDRLECFQAGKFACDSNQKALDAIRVATEALHGRTRERRARQVEGKNVV